MRGYTVGQLRKEAINDLMIYSVKVAGMTEKDVVAIRYEQAFRELSLYGNDTYMAARAQVGEIARNSRKYLPDIPLWRDMWDKVTANWHKNDYDGQRVGAGQPSKKAHA